MPYIGRILCSTKDFFESFCCHVATLIDIQRITGGNKGGNNTFYLSFHTLFEGAFDGLFSFRLFMRYILTIRDTVVPHRSGKLSRPMRTNVRAYSDKCPRLLDSLLEPRRNKTLICFLVLILIINW